MVEYLTALTINFVFVFGSMALFFMPFVLVFWWRHRHDIRAAHPHFNYFMERFFASSESNYMVALWAAAEACIWFIIPEFLLLLMVFMKVKRKINLVKYDIIGTAIGTIVAFAWHASDATLLKFPYIYQGMIDHVRGWYTDLGVWGLLYQPFSGVPYKVFTHIAPDYAIPIVLFLGIAVIVRMSRYLIVYEVSRALYPLLHRVVRRHYGILFVFGILVFTMMLVKVSDVYR